ncbi:hypothetical protein T05_4585 [Trichinella murrelli]|uniref:Uncharacterized protein n=1 Tax=Trichinella murrelli TaxID=144512 RepID=A0A0V0TUE5_9BILA|nr:hypothetical protein T05_4585 [Trichinella murrelli]
MPLLLHLLTTWINRNQNFSELTTSCTVLMQHDICGSSAMKMQIYKMPRTSSSCTLITYEDAFEAPFPTKITTLCIALKY